MTTNLGHRIGLTSIKIEDRNPEQNQVGEVGNMSTGAADAGDRGEEFECHTPTSDENKIPITLICPPAPRKPTKRSSISCKRKLFDVNQFVETVKREEIDEFFRSNFELVARRRMIAKKRCKCT
ncbi:cyclin-dependent protein kinase inhibitor SMR1-like [Pistacia vera]|uniref:Uncharacterized protein n=1 Tax=Pistacia atlantica TaxID=434234 RepID=A0ACC1BX12_9ROSI|nr:cyclin-dependent protein kinase inhibitor SMR1-like [Pistacia vera]KAJ0103607.1 hypothetical protein Patl1_05988 [Pistacia atlantica]